MSALRVTRYASFSALRAMRLALCFMGALLFALCCVASAQQPKIARIGFLSGDPDVEVFRQALRDIGYIERKNILLEYRDIGGQREKIPSLVSELLALNVDVLVARAQPAIRAAKQASKSIPVVMMTTQDPVAAGFISNLARPGANITGITTLQRELSGKRLEVLKETLPEVSRVAALMNATSIGDFKMYEAPAGRLKIQLQSVHVQGSNPDFEGAFQAAVKGRANALIPITNAAINRYSEKIAELAIKNHMPSMCERSDYVEAGGLMSYAADEAESYKRVALYVDKILKGAKPADLPVEQASKFELVINVRTAKQIGVIIPSNVLARADRVIK